MFRMTFKRIKWFYQKIVYGYSDVDLWDLHSFIVKKTLPPLKAFKEMRRYSYPPEVGSLEAWNEILGKILWAFENSDFVYEDMEAEELQKKYDKINEGMALFGKYFQHLWD